MISRPKTKVQVKKGERSRQGGENSMFLRGLQASLWLSIENGLGASITILVGSYWYCIVVKISLSLLAICIFFFVKCPSLLFLFSTEFFIYSGYKPLIRYMIYNYFLPFIIP